MTIFEMTDEEIRKLPTTTFSAVGIKERKDLQRLLREQIDVIAPDIMVIAEEFGEWEDSKRRIDLLGIDKQGNLVVVELKRTMDGGHMELQALRYAALVSSMTFDDAVAAYMSYAKKSVVEAQQDILDFLGWEASEEESFAEKVRIVLASADFSKEVTTTVLWLNDQDLNIRCVRMVPYTDGTRVFLDVQTIIPLPEAADYINKKRKKDKERQPHTPGYKNDLFDVRIGQDAFEKVPRAEAFFKIVKYLCDLGVTPDQISSLVTWRSICINVDGELNSADFAAKCRTEFGRKFSPERFFCENGQLVFSGGKTYAFIRNWGPRLPQALTLVVDAFADKGVECSGPIASPSVR